MVTHSLTHKPSFFVIPKYARFARSSIDESFSQLSFFPIFTHIIKIQSKIWIFSLVSGVFACPLSLYVYRLDIKSETVLFQILKFSPYTEFNLYWQFLGLDQVLQTFLLKDFSVPCEAMCCFNFGAFSTRFCLPFGCNWSSSPCTMAYHCSQPQVLLCMSEQYFKEVLLNTVGHCSSKLVVYCFKFWKIND